MRIPIALWHSLFHLMPRLHLGMDPIFRNCDLHSPGHALSFIAAGEVHRQVGSNNFNLLSSRSYTIFTLCVNHVHSLVPSALSVEQILQIEFLLSLRNRIVLLCRMKGLLHYENSC